MENKGNRSSALYADNINLVSPNLNLITLLAVAATIITICVVLSNITIVTAMLMSRDSRPSHNDNNITQLLMLSMACVDLLIGAFHMPVSVVQIVCNGRWILGEEFCIIWHNIGNAFGGVTSSHILCMAVDKYLAICHPLFYRILTKRIGHAMVILSWALPSAMFLLPLVSDRFVIGIDKVTIGEATIILCSPVLNSEVLLLFYSLGFYLPIFATYILYALIFSEIRKFNKRKDKIRKVKFQLNVYPKINQRSVLSVVESSPCSSNNSPNSTRLSGSNEQQMGDVSSDKASKAKMARQFSRNMKAIRTLVAIVLGFTFFWMPVWIYVAIYCIHHTSLPFSYILFIGWLGYLNSTINPVLYGFFKPIRKALKVLLGSLK